MRIEIVAIIVPLERCLTGLFGVGESGVVGNSGVELGGGWLRVGVVWSWGCWVDCLLDLG